MRANNTKSRTIFNFLIFAMMILGWAVMAFHYKGDALTAAGIASMRFFTVQSNVFRGIVSLLTAVFLVTGTKEQKERRVRRMRIWNYMSTCSVGLTFLVVFVFFGPLYGLTGLLKGANFFFHLLIPLLSMTEFVIFNEKKISMPLLLTAAIPPLLYGFCYLINLLVNGIGYGPTSNDWYGFAKWGIPVGLCIFASICAASILIGAVLSCLNRAVQKKRHS